MDIESISAIGEALQRKGWQLATAESCTGGLVAHWITAIPGCSQWYCGGVVAYANATKTAMLGVPAGLLVQHGAVSRPVAAAMARGACKQIPAADVAIGITGVAGPDGGTPAKPVGCVYLALADKAGFVVVQKWQFPGSREEIQIAAGKAALQMVYDYLSGNAKKEHERLQPQ
ncbi:MAG: CinA family protein [Kiritimatiellia bacterium]